MTSIGDRLHFLWNGPSDLPRALRLEWRFVAVRWLGIVGLAPVLLAASLTPDRLVFAYCVLAIAALYNAGLQRVMLRRPEWLASGYVSTIGDGLLDVAMVIVGGGFGSPFYLVLFTFTIAAAMRYGYGPSLGVSLLCVTTDAIGYLISRQQVGAGFVVRSLLLPLTTILAGYLREQANLAEAALQERLRQSNTLNDVSGRLAASLELDAVMRAAVSATAQIFQADGVVLRTTSTTFCQGDFPELLEELERASESHPPRVSHETVLHVALSEGRQATVIDLVGHNTWLATIAIGPTRAAPDPDIVASFVERVTLAAENASLYRNLATAHQDLLSVDEMKTNFLANVSHELRTPLTSIRSFSELLLQYDEEPHVQKEFLHIICTESERLTRLVNDVLDISRIEAGHMNWQMDSVDVASLLDDLVRTFGPLIALANLRFQTEIQTDLPSVYGDRDRLNQVIANLLNNAMKFTRPGGTITLSAGHADSDILISVTDTGVGIAPGDQSRIFEKFQQLGDTLTDKPRGTGLGLPICRDIVEHHSGRLWVESMPDQGSTFSVALPAELGRDALARAA